MLFLLVFTSQTPTRKYSVAYCATHTVERQCRALSSKAALPHALNTAAMPRNVERSSMPHYVLHDTLYNVCMPQNRNARNTVERQCRTMYCMTMFCGTAAAALPLCFAALPPCFAALPPCIVALRGTFFSNEQHGVIQFSAAGLHEHKVLGFVFGATRNKFRDGSLIKKTQKKKRLKQIQSSCTCAVARLPPPPPRRVTTCLCAQRTTPCSA